MNKYILSSILFCSSLLLNAQSRKEFKWGFSISLNSIHSQVEVPMLTGPGSVFVDADGNILTGGSRIDKSISFSIIPTYTLNENILLRLDFGITNLNLKSNLDQVFFSLHNILKTHVSTQIIRLTPGLQWYFMKTRYIDSYFGTTIGYSIYKPIKRTSNFESRELATDTLIFHSKLNETTTGGYSLGIGAFIGFNIYLKKWISLGAELSSGANYYKLGDQTVAYGIEQSIPNPLVASESRFTNSYEGFKISKVMSSYHISIWF